MTGNEYVARLRTGLTRFHDEAGKFVQDSGTDPASGSVAATERTTYARPESLVSAAAVGVILLEAVGEHVTAFVKNITEPVEPIACWTCVRSMLESASIAAWMFDPNIDAKTRVERTFAYRYEGMEQELKFARAVGLPAEVTKLETRLDDLENTALGLGFPRVLNKDNDRIGVAKKMPSATNMIKSMLDEEKAYRLLSAVAHGHIWAIQALGFTPGVVHLGGEGRVTTTEVKKHSGTPQGYGFLGLRVAKSLAMPLWYQCLYFGWDKERLKQVLESAYDAIMARDAVRFWR